MRLIPMTGDERAAYREHIVTTFAEEKARSEGLGDAEARSAAEKAVESALARNPDDHVMTCVEHDGERVGFVWFVVREEWGEPTLWRYAILIDSAHRGRGLGRTAMGLVEREATTRGASSIGLHVFGHNDVALRLYEDLGFRPTSIVMRKPLPPQPDT